MMVLVMVVILMCDKRVGVDGHFHTKVAGQAQYRGLKTYQNI